MGSFANMVTGVFMKEQMKKENLFKIYLACNAREKLVRFIEREHGLESSKVADAKLPQVEFEVALHSHIPGSVLTCCDRAYLKRREESSFLS